VIRSAGEMDYKVGQLLLAVKNGAAKHDIRDLVNSGVDVNGIHSGKTALHEAVRSGNLRMVQLLCEDYNVDESIRDSQGNVPLDIAKENCRSDANSMEIVYYLSTPSLKRRTKAKRPTKKAGPAFKRPNANAMLRAAAQIGDLDGVRHAMEIGADIHSRNQFGATALHVAVAENCIRMAKLLVQEYGADVALTKNYGDSALHWACAEGHVKMATMLVEELGAQVNLQNSSGATPLHHATYYGHFDVTSALVHRLGAELTLVNNIGKTPFDMCSIEGESDAALAKRRQDVAEMLSLLEDESDMSDMEGEIMAAEEVSSPKSSSKGLPNTGDNV